MEDQLDLIIKQNKQKEDLHGEANLLLEEVALKGAKGKDIKDLKDSINTSIKEHSDDLSEDVENISLKVGESGKMIAESIESLKPQINKMSSATEFINNFLEALKGVDGKTPEKGKDYFTNDEIEYIVSSCIKKIRVPKDGEKGDKGDKGDDGKDAIINYDEIVKKLVKKLPKIEKNTEKTSEQIIEELKGKISYTDLKDLPTIFKGGARDYDFLELKDVPKTYAGQAGKFAKVNNSETGLEFGSGDGVGDVIGPSSATDSNFVSFDNTSGKLIKDSGKKASDFQTVLGFTPENVANKENTTIDTSTTKYPTVNLLKTGLDGLFRSTADVTSAELLTGSADNIIYVKSKEAFYKYCATCTIARDGDLILNTGNAGNTRWQLIQKVSRTQGDTGWVNTDSATFTKVSATKARLTLSSSGTISINSIRIELAAGNYDYDVTGTAGLRYIYFDDATGVLKGQTTLWNFGSQVPVMLIYWSGTAIVGGLQTELHGIRDTVWHLWAHEYLGTQYKDGMTFTGSVQTDNNTDPNVDTCQYLWSTAGTAQDEDAVFTPGTGVWAQTLGSGLTSTTAAIFNFFYYNGTNITTLNAMSDRTPFIHAGGNTAPQWESSGTLTAAVTGNYVVYHYFASPMIDGWSIFARPHNAVYTSLSAATAANPSQLTWSSYAELKHLYTAIFRVNTGWAPSPVHGCKLVALNDFRRVSANPVSGSPATDHNALSNRSSINSHPILASYGTVDGAIPFHSTTSLGLVESSSLNWNDSTKVLALGTGSVTLSGSLAATGTRITKGWFTDIESTNYPSIGGTSILAKANTFTGIQKFATVAQTYTASKEFQLTFTAGSAGDTIDIQFPNENRVFWFEIDLCGGINSGNAQGRITKTIAVRTASNTVNEVTESVTLIQGTIVNLYSIGTISYDATAGKYIVPIGKVFENTNAVIARVRAMTNAPTTFDAFIDGITISTKYNTTTPAKNTLSILGSANTWTGVNTITNATASSSTITGAQVITGGQGIGGNQFVGGTGSYTGLLTSVGGEKTSTVYNLYNYKKSLGQVNLNVTNNCVNIVVAQNTSHSGNIEINISSSFSAINAHGRMTKNITFANAAGGAPTIYAEKMMLMTGNISNQYGIGTATQDGTNIIIPIYYLGSNAGNNPVVVYIEGQVSGTSTYSDAFISALALSAPYTGTPGTKNSMVNTAATNFGLDTASSDTYVVTLNPAPGSYETGTEYIFKAVTANTGAATVNINSLGAKTIVKGVNTTLSDNDILANMFCKIVYDGTNFVLLNPRTL